MQGDVPGGDAPSLGCPRPGYHALGVHVPGVHSWSGRLPPETDLSAIGTFYVSYETLVETPFLENKKPDNSKCFYLIEIIFHMEMIQFNPHIP